MRDLFHSVHRIIPDRESWVLRLTALRDSDSSRREDPEWSFSLTDPIAVALPSTLRRPQDEDGCLTVVPDCRLLFFQKVALGFSLPIHSRLIHGCDVLPVRTTTAP